MATLIRVWNRALGLARADAVQSPTEDTTSARACRRFWDDSRDAVLRAYPWNTAARRVHLPALTAAPPFGYRFRYRLPDDCLAVRELWGVREPWAVEGREIVTDAAAPLPLVYTARLDDPALFDALLMDAVASRLAFDMAPMLTENATLAEALWGRYQQLLKEARGIDAAEGTAPALTGDFSWMEARA